MLTIKQVEKIAEEGVEIIIKRGYHPQGYKGWWLPDERQVRAYLPAHKSRSDIAVTLIHELIHARDEDKKAARNKGRERTIETEAKKTYEKNPSMLEFITELYSLQL